MAITAVAVAALAMAAVCVLLAVVAADRRRIRALTSQVGELHGRMSTPAPAPGPVEPAEAAVAVITGLAPGPPHAPAEAPTTGRIVSVTLAGPLVKVAALYAGVRRALAEETRMRAGYAFRRELKQQRRARRRARANPPRGAEGWLP